MLMRKYGIFLMAMGVGVYTQLRWVNELERVTTLNFFRRGTG